ncbi:MAG TPA: putative Ig domain-containing protein [Steroidobacteraceae bacterium]
MGYAQRCIAAPVAHYVLYALVAALVSACGADGSSATSMPLTQSDTAPVVSAPLISGSPDTTVVAGTQYSFQPGASDSDGDALVFSVKNLPAWATFDTASGVVSGTPAASDVGSYQSITITVADGSATAQLAPFNIQVTPPVVVTPTNAPPTITGMAATSVQAGSHYAFQPSAADPDKNPLVFSVSGLPSWASFSTSTGLLSGTPSSANVGAFPDIVISVSDGHTQVFLQAFTITVTAIPPASPKNTPPKITGTPATSVRAGSAYSFQPAASDADGNKLTFAIANKPAWANFSTTTGQLGGTPGTTNIGSYANIAISVSDGTNTVSLPAFTLQVTAPPASSAPPTISGTPATTAQAGTAYSFTPTAHDASGKTLSFSVQNKPSWAAFSIATGQLSGTPTTSNVGTYANIIITVSNGTTSAALAAFTITVAADPSTSQKVGTATVKWTPPSKNTDGSPITNLSGYVISYGTNANMLSQTISVTAPSATSYTVQNLGQGTWYFAVSATASDGTTSVLSSVVSKTIQ